MELLVALLGSLDRNREGVLKPCLLPVLRLGGGSGFDNLDNRVRRFLRLAITEDLVREGAALAQPDELQVAAGGVENSIHKVPL